MLNESKCSVSCRNSKVPDLSALLNRVFCGLITILQLQPRNAKKCVCVWGGGGGRGVEDDDTLYFEQLDLKPNHELDKY